MLNKTILVSLTFFIFFSVNTHAELRRLTVCTDKGYWYPFTFTELYQAEGLYIDMLKKAGKRIHVHMRVRAMDWEKCLKWAKDGKVAGVLGASYKDKRAEYLEYPKDAKTHKVSDQRLTQVEYVVVNPSTSHYIYDGNVKALPEPVRVPKGYSVADDLKKEGVRAIDSSSKGDQGTFLKLITDMSGSVVTLKTIAERFMNHPVFKGKIKIQDKTYKSKSYFLTFAKTSNLKRKPPIGKEDRERIWNAIKTVREDKKLMTSYLEKY